MMPQYKYELYWLNSLFLLKSNVLACCITDNKEDGAILEVESIVVVRDAPILPA